MSWSTLALMIAAAMGIVAPGPFLILLGAGLEPAELLWVLGSNALAGVLALGLGVRLVYGRPVISTGLLLVGAFAPSSAWFWLPPVYLLTAAIVVLALVTARNPPVVVTRPL